MFNMLYIFGHLDTNYSCLTELFISLEPSFAQRRDSYSFVKRNIYVSLYVVS